MQHVELSRLAQETPLRVLLVNAGEPDSLTWSINGKDMRTLNRKDTWNATSGRFDYPQTPSRIMLSLWPAGLPTNAKGTVEWAGGEIDWNSKYMENGYYYARFQEVSVQCYDPPSGAQTKGSKSYKYTDAAGTNNTVAITNDQVILGSLIHHYKAQGISEAYKVVGALEFLGNVSKITHRTQ